MTKRLIQMFLVFFKIGAFTLGGGYAMVPLMKKEIAGKRKWLSDEEFVDILAVAQSAPGPIAINTSVYVGYKMGGFIGSIVATLGSTLPSFITILLIAMFFTTIKDQPLIEAIFKGIRPAVAAMIGASVITLLKSAKIKSGALTVTFLAAVAIIVFNLHPILVIILAALGGISAMAISGGEERGSTD
ncbi:chromate transporter [Caldanaerobius fijiensis DSM 17918]|uniref:Chromate transporter n=2 Tax=Caldanaerobius TaxID=862261 RepID=A0A1M4W623_9THEO|nr:chromate transporter [Caldanaerobius fijiensis]SHE76600.1 chromate transporter [Caldanaerobius fijiensis DSM 17918]